MDKSVPSFCCELPFASSCLQPSLSIEFLFRLAMLHVHVSFPSGSGDTLVLPEHSKVGDLKLKAQKTFRKGLLKLVGADGHILTDRMDSLQAAGVHDGEHLTAVAQQLQIASAESAFVLWCCGGSKIITWGNPGNGGDCSAVQDQLLNVQQIQATERAFAAILADGSVVAWEDPDRGGDCSAVQERLKNVQAIQATAAAFAAILADGSVVAWGQPRSGGNCSAVQDQLEHVQQIQAT